MVLYCNMVYDSHHHRHRNDHHHQHILYYDVTLPLIHHHHHYHQRHRHHHHRHHQHYAMCRMSIGELVCYYVMLACRCPAPPCPTRQLSDNRAVASTPRSMSMRIWSDIGPICGGDGDGDVRSARGSHFHGGEGCPPRQSQYHASHDCGLQRHDDRSPR